jgi:acetyltransferase-like isoleucine patch superfamily enzyme
MMLIKSLWYFWIRAHRLYWLGKSQFLYRHVFASLGLRSSVINPLKIAHPEYIHVGRQVTINSFTWLGVYPQPGFDRPRLEIGDGSEVGHFNHITCVNCVKLGAKVLTADRVHISDNEHVFADIKVPIIDQGVTSRGPVDIGEGTWLGENVNVLSCRIGKHCVVGANSVVISDIPDYSVAVGVPARVVKRYNLEKGQWLKINGELLRD